LVSRSKAIPDSPKLLVSLHLTIDGAPGHTLPSPQTILSGCVDTIAAMTVAIRPTGGATVRYHAAAAIKAPATTRRSDSPLPSTMAWCFSEMEKVQAQKKMQSKIETQKCRSEKYAEQT